jgi:hypothetical protein
MRLSWRLGVGGWGGWGGGNEFSVEWIVVFGRVNRATRYQTRKRNAVNDGFLLIENLR